MQHARAMGDTLNRFLLIPLVILSLLMPACMPKIPGLNQMKPDYYPQCYQPFADLEKAQDGLIKRTVIGAGVGALGGAALGFLKTGDAKGALIGGGAGLFAGTALGYGFGKMKQIQDDRERMRSYQADMNADMRNASRVEQYAMASLQCYTREFNSLLTQYKAGQITKVEVQARYSEIRRGMNYISEILVNSKNELLKRDGEYREAFEAEAKAKNKATPKVASLEKKRELAAKRRTSSKVEGNGGNELSQMSAEINRKKIQAEHKVQKIEQLEAAQVAAAGKSREISSINSVSTYYEKQYLDSLVSLEEAENVNQRTLTAMSVAAQHAGIDMV